MKRIIAMSACIVILLCMSPISRADLGERLPFNEISAMSNYMNGGRFIISGNWIYGTNYYETKASLSRRSTSNLSDLKQINKGINSLYLFKEGSWIYYLAVDLYHDNSTSIRRVPLSGDGEEVLISEEDISDVEEISSLFSYNGQIYFSVMYSQSRGEGGLYRAKLDGNGITKVVDRVGWLPYITNDKLYYVYKSDLFVCDLEGNNKTKPLSNSINTYVTNGMDIYYETRTRRMKKYSIADATTESLSIRAGGMGFAYDGIYIYYSNVEDDYRLYSYNTITQEINLVSDDPYIGNITILREGVLCYFQYSEDFSTVNHIFYIGFDGSQKGTFF